MRRIAPLAALALTVAFTGCGKKDAAPATAPATTAPATTAPAAGAPVTAIEITGNDALQFNTTAFTVAAGSNVTITFKNVGTQPKETMGHNFVILKPGTDVAAFSATAMQATDNNYVPRGDASVVAFTKVLGPGETEALALTAPSTPGQYPFICSFPGHSGTMKGIMTVQ